MIKDTEVIASQAEKWKTKMKTFCEITTEKVIKAEEKTKEMEERVVDWWCRSRRSRVWGRVTRG